MAKKKEEYVPQFDYSDFDETKTEKPKRQKCLSCGNYSASLVDGVCFTCRNKLDLYTNKTTVQEPNVNLHLDWCEQTSIERACRWHFGFLLHPFFKYGIGTTIWFLVATHFALFNFMGLLNCESISDFLVVAIFSSIPTAIFVTVGVISAKNINKKRIKRFNKFNSQKVQLTQNDSWICPCCHRINETISYCKDCGVFPQLHK